MTFSALLRRSMAERGVTVRQLADVCGVSQTSVTQWRRDAALPTLANAAVIADELHAPALARQIIAARTRTCKACGAEFVTSSQYLTRARYCGRACQERAWRRRQRSSQRMRDTLVLRRQLAVLQQSVAEMCRSCEPEGLCRDAACALRPVSPLRLRQVRAA